MLITHLIIYYSLVFLDCLVGSSHPSLLPVDWHRASPVLLDLLLSILGNDILNLIESLGRQLTHVFLHELAKFNLLKSDFFVVVICLLMLSLVIFQQPFYLLFVLHFRVEAFLILRFLGSRQDAIFLLQTSELLLQSLLLSLILFMFLKKMIAADH